MKLFRRGTPASLSEIRTRVRLPVPPPPEPVAVAPAPAFSYSDPRPADQAIPFALKVSAGIAWRVVVIAIALYGLGMIIGRTSSVVIPVAVALLLTALTMPLAVLLNHRLHFPRGLAAITTLLVSVGVVAGLLTLAGNQIVIGVQGLSTSAGLGLSQIQAWLSNGPLGGQIDEAINQGRAWVQSHAGDLTSGALSAGQTAGNLAVGAIMTMFAMFFFLADGDRMWSWCVGLAPKQVREPVHEAGRRAWVTLSSYVKTQVLVAGVDAVFISLGAFLLGLPLVIPLGLIVFFASAIPMVGAVVSGALAVLLALVVKGPLASLIMLGVVLAVQQIEGNLLQPILMSKAVSLHPLATLLGVAVGSYLFGIAGALFAVPLMAITNTVVLYLNGHDKFPMLGQDASILTNSAKKLSGDAAERDEAVTPGAGDNDKLIGGINPEAHEREQQAEDAAAEAATHDETVDSEGTVEKRS
ncbi:AI-2E family transporter [Mobilicoccus pelagius]|uniref:AI-2E family transporter n=1 Tax=Mobilicoccus pelagius NBRC 104925 TaxID=1089455 RepID=H5UT60_9MICO|nr:AI-2E family transporter [Mobilicoccus pelagius]GAB48918.1 hypothetical protein MOPEL_085_00040 [Mobilicoccus pelagius NBRC 104925]